MANTSRPFGVRPERYMDGAAWNGATTLYAFSASDATAAYKGDMVSFDATNRSTALTDIYAPGIPFVKTVAAALTTSTFRGVIAGFVPQPEFNQTATASLGFMYRAASTARYVWVVDDPAVVFECQESGTNSYVTAANNGINKTCDIAYSAGSTTTGIGNTTILGTSFQTAAVRPWRALRYTQRVDNFNFSAADSASNAHWDLIIANSDLANANLGA